MALPPLDQANTVRWYLKYQVSRFNHTLQMRTSAAATEADVTDAFNNFLTALSPLLWLSPIISLERSAKGSNVRLPVSTAGLEEAYGTGVPADNVLPWGVNFAGRSLLGRRTHVYVLNVKAPGDNNFTLTSAENATVAAAVNALNTSGAGLWYGIDEVHATFYERATIKQNDHVVKLLRGT